MPRNQWLLTAALCVVAFLGGWVTGGGKFPAPPSTLAPAKVTAATYFFPNRGSTPPSIQSGLSEINSQGITATTHEEGTTNAAGHVPKQHEKSYPEALKAGLPCLVVIRSDGSLRVVKVTTKAEVLEACK